MRRVITSLLFGLGLLSVIACVDKEAEEPNSYPISDADSTTVDSEEVPDEDMIWRQPPDIAFSGLDNVMEHVHSTSTQLAYSSVPDVVQMVVTNSSEWDIVSEPGYEISRKEGDDWVLLDMSHITFEQENDSIKIGESKTFNINLFSDKLSYNEGVYRIRKLFSFEWARFEQDIEIVIE
ncbi:MAG: immunoglobulin-like domain-containing protein [Flavobacterium sp.]